MEDFTKLSPEDLQDIFGSAKEIELETGQEEKPEPKQQEEKPIAEENNNSSESGGDGNNNKSENTPPKSAEDSPNFYSSIAKALREEGIFPDLTDIESIKDAGSFKKMFEAQVDSRLNSQQKRVLDALNSGVDESEIQKVTSNIEYLERLKESDITAVTEQAENIRKQLIYADLINKGFSPERAKKSVDKLVETGNDVDEAKEAWTSIKQYWINYRDNMMAEAEKEKQNIIQARQKQMDDLKKSIDDKENAFNSISLNSELKKKIYENLTKPVYKGPDGNYYTAIQKYQMEHNQDFMRYMGTFYTLTDGFTDFSKLFAPVANAAAKKGFSELEGLLKGKTSPADGNLSMLGGRSGNEAVDDFFKQNWTVSKD